MVKVLLDDLNFFSILRCISLYKTQFQIVSLQKSKQSKFSTLFLKALSIQCDLLPQDIDNLFSYRENHESVTRFNLQIEKDRNLHQKNFILFKKFFPNSEDILIKKLSHHLSMPLITALDLIYLASYLNVSILFLHDSKSAKIVEHLGYEKKIDIKTYNSLLIGYGSCRPDYEIFDKYYYENQFHKIKNFLKAHLSSTYSFLYFCLKLNTFRAPKSENTNHLFGLVSNPKSNYFNDLPFASSFLELGNDITLCAVGSKQLKVMQSFADNTKLRCYQGNDLYFALPINLKLKVLSKCLLSAFNLFLIFPLGGSLSLAADLTRSNFFSTVCDYYFQLYQVKILWTNIEGDDYFVLGSVLAAKKQSILTAGLSWSMPPITDIDFNIFRNDIFFTWADKQHNLFEESGALVKEFIPITYPVNLKPYKEAFQQRDQKSNIKWIVYMENLAGPNLPISNSDQEILRKKLFEILESNPNLGLIFKPKNPDYDILKHQHLFDSMYQRNRLIIEHERGNFNPENKGDIVLTCGSQSLAFASHAIGLPYLTFDPCGYCDDIALLSLDNFFSFKNIDSLEEAINKSLESGQDNQTYYKLNNASASPAEDITKILISRIKVT